MAQEQSPGRGWVVTRAVTAVAAVAHLHVEDALMSFKGFVVSLSSPHLEGHCEGALSFFYRHNKGTFKWTPFYLCALHSLFLLLFFFN